MKQRIIAAVLSLTLLSGCSVKRQQGFIVKPQEVYLLRQKAASKKAVRAILGEPVDIAFDNPNIWYYAFEDLRRYGPLPWKVVDSQAWVLGFDAQERLRHVTSYGPADRCRIKRLRATSPDNRRYVSRSVTAMVGQFSPLASWKEQGHALRTGEDIAVTS